MYEDIRLDYLFTTAKEIWVGPLIQSAHTVWELFFCSDTWTITGEAFLTFHSETDRKFESRSGVISLRSTKSKEHEQHWNPNAILMKKNTY